MEIVVVIIIAVAVFVLGSLVRGKEEEREGDRARGGRPTRRAASDLDRFLEEARRRRQSAEQRRAMPTEPPPPPKPVERPKSRPPVEARPVQPRRRPAPPAPAPRPAKRSSARPLVAEVIPVAVAVELSQSDRVPARERLGPSTDARPALGAPDTTPPPIQATATVVVRRQLESAAVAQVAAMLRSPQTMRSAVVLQEILAPPLCKRQRQ